MQGATEKRMAQDHALTMENRRRAVVTGVQDVECFNEEVVLLVTSAGTLTITGASLNIPELRVDEGRLVVEGELRTAEYEGRMCEGKGGLLGRLFR